jgi:hypothetical protein
MSAAAGSVRLANYRVLEEFGAFAVEEGQTFLSPALQFAILQLSAML